MAAFAVAFTACQKHVESESTIGVLSGVVETRADGDVDVPHPISSSALRTA